MRSASSRIGVALLALLILSSPAFALDLSKSIGRLEGAGSDGGSICTAVVIAEGIALTAAHCVDFEGKASFTFKGRDAELIRFNRVLDLAILKFNPDGEIPIILADKAPETGDAIVVTGYPFGIEQVAYQFGHVALNLENETKLMWLDVNLIPGNSGGPCVTPEGKLVGIDVSIFYKGPAHLAAAVPLNVVRDYIKPLLKK